MQIEPKILKGFRDFLPDAEARRKHLQAILERTFTSFGFVPIDTPILEYTEVLLGKGGGETDKQVYRFADNGGRDVAMRFDLTVPFARYMALHRHELYLPFRRYHISKVFRGENTQRGRYREFMQCDFDVVGTDSTGADLDTVLLVLSSFAAIGVPAIRIHLSHRGIFNRFLALHGVADKTADVLRSVDKLRKIGADQTRALLEETVGAETAAGVLAFVGATGNADTVLATITGLAGGANPESERVAQLFAAAQELGVADSLVLDPSITRGLDYYTGLVFETFLVGAESIGSVCSGGRYNDLVGLYSKEAMPGVGGSIGLDRLLAALDELGGGATVSAAPDVLIASQDATLLGHYHGLAQRWRAAGLKVEVFPEEKKPAQQFAHAERKGIPFVVLCSAADRAVGVVNVRRIADRTTHDHVPEDQVPPLINGETR